MYTLIAWIVSLIRCSLFEWKWWKRMIGWPNTVVLLDCWFNCLIPLNWQMWGIKLPASINFVSLVHVQGSVILIISSTVLRIFICSGADSERRHAQDYGIPSTRRRRQIRSRVNSSRFDSTTWLMMQTWWNALPSESSLNTPLGRCYGVSRMHSFMNRRLYR